MPLSSTVDDLPILLDRRSILDTALRPEAIEPARNVELRPDPDIAFEHFSIIPYVPHDPHRPVLGEADLLPVASLGADEASHGGLIGRHRGRQSLRRDAKLVGIDHGKVSPLDDIEPLVIAEAHSRPERLLRDDVRKDDVIVRSLKLQSLSKERRDIAG